MPDGLSKSIVTGPALVDSESVSNAIALESALRATPPPPPPPLALLLVVLGVLLELELESSEPPQATRPNDAAAQTARRAMGFVMWRFLSGGAAGTLLPGLNAR